MFSNSFNCGSQIDHTGRVEGQRNTGGGVSKDLKEERPYALSFCNLALLLVISLDLTCVYDYFGPWPETRTEMTPSRQRADTFNKMREKPHLGRSCCLIQSGISWAQTVSKKQQQSVTLAVLVLLAIFIIVLKKQLYFNRIFFIRQEFRVFRYIFGFCSC